jgi:hypothetical protein
VQRFLKHVFCRFELTGEIVDKPPVGQQLF